MSLFAEGSFSLPATDDSSNLASSSSTPPTTVADSDSLHSDISRHDVITVADDAASAPPAVVVAPIVPVEDVPSPRRPQRARASLPVYNLAKLSGTSAHGKRRAKGDVVSERRRRTFGDLGADGVLAGAQLRGVGKTANESIDALNLDMAAGMQNSPQTRRQTRASPRSIRSSRLSAISAPVTNIGTKLSALGKRNRKSTEKAIVNIPRELRRLQDTKEFSHIDEAPVVYTVWSNGKYVDPKQAAEPPARKKAKLETPEQPTKEEEVEPITQTKKRQAKKFLAKGLYSGQDLPPDVTRGLSTAEKKQLAQLPELTPRETLNSVMPQPIFTGFRILLNGRDFKLPYHVCNPLPPGQPKPDEWKKMTKNRFIGESKEIWKKMPHMHDYQSKCVCLPEDGCGESCQNRIMLYECDETNCNVGKAHCMNRAFADLTARRAKGGKYRVGVEVIKTSDRGYGVRSNRCFKPHQIIMEYAGEIITEEECERRMNEIYKHNECYYLMSFDQNMIIDATTGSIARFVNHSCNPNCRMIKWIVSGQPRMALFAGDKPIMTGEELTYDYNFDPFSAKNVQKCLCGQPNCRGVLGPKPREVKVPKADLKNTVKATVKAGKRKLKELIGNERENPTGRAKKRKVQLKPSKKVQPKGLKKSISKTSLTAAKGAATAIKKRVKSITVSSKKTSVATKKVVSKAKLPLKERAAGGSIAKTTTTLSKKRVIKTYGSGAVKAKQAKSKVSSGTIVALGDGKAKKATPKKISATKTSPKKISPSGTPIIASAPTLKTVPLSPREPLGAIEISAN